MDFALRDCSISALVWNVDVAILSAVEIIAVPVDACIELCLVKSAQSSMLSPVPIESVLSIALEAFIVETCVKILKYHVGVLR